MLALILLAAPPLAAAITVAARPGTATGPGIEDSLSSVSGPVAAPGRYRGHTAYEWAGRFRGRTRQYQNARRVLSARPSVREAIELAAATYGSRALLWALARCETGGTFDPQAKNPQSDASGLLQFMPGTFARTPYGHLSIWSPYASAMAAGWMVAHGRRSAWVC